MRAEPVKAVDHDPGHGDATSQNLPDGIRMQRGVADPITGADFSKQRPGFPAGDRLPGLEGAHRAGFHMASTLSEPVGDDADVLNTQRHELGATQCADEAEQ